MCGIAGFELGNAPEAVAERLLKRLAHRGPDGGWFQRVGDYGLVQTRLAVIDLHPHVRYPLVNEGGDLHLLFNGEIYEHSRHHQDLAARGHRFTTECDAEVLLHGYEEWGPAVFARLDGMFAAALLDVRSGELILVRDALGVKPLVYTTEAPFAFASEAVSLVAAGLAPATLDLDAAGEYLAYHYVAPPRTGLRQIQQLEPGSVLRRARDGSVAVTRWRPRPFTTPSSGRAVTTEDVAAALDQSVARQLVADVPVGILLSSGIDSSLVLDAAVRTGNRPTAFTIGFRGHGDYDEVQASARLAEELGVEHIVEELSGGFAEVLCGVCAAMDQPLGDASSIATRQLARLARQHVTVALTGTGGDDLFAGYYRHRAHKAAAVVQRLPPIVLERMRQLPLERGSERTTLMTLGRSYARRLASLSATDGFPQYLELLKAAGEEFPKVASRDRAAETGPRAALAEMALRDGDTLLRQIQAFELATYLPGDLLPKEDRMTMAEGLEARVPLLGSEMLELAEQAEDRQKATVRTGKRLLRTVARQRLPRYVAAGRKRGFAVPLKDLFAGPWRAEAHEWFESSSSTVLDMREVARRFADDSLPPTDAWAAAVFAQWEQELRDASTGA